ncbi:MAG: hypothetical protein GY869_24820 [Planctomycetes bacterium]|nr:hypothetical protein [Planctomycetota bacterium]
MEKANPVLTSPDELEFNHTFVSTLDANLVNIKISEQHRYLLLNLLEILRLEESWTNKTEYEQVEIRNLVDEIEWRLIEEF